MMAHACLRPCSAVTTVLITPELIGGSGQQNLDIFSFFLHNHPILKVNDLSGKILSLHGKVRTQHAVPENNQTPRISMLIPLSQNRLKSIQNKHA